MTAVDLHHQSVDHSLPPDSKAAVFTDAAACRTVWRDDDQKAHPSPSSVRPAIVILLVRGEATPFRLQWETKIICEAVSPLSPKIRVCTTQTLAKSLDEECASGARIWVHLIGHQCATAPNSNCREEILYLDASHGRLAVKKASVPHLKYSFPQMIHLLKRPDIELVFFNASHTKALADCMTGIYSFGWASLCLEQGAHAFARAFYTALARSLNFDQAFQSACSELTHSKMKVSIPTGPRSNVNAAAALSFCDPEAWVESRKRKRQQALSLPAATFSEAKDTPLRTGLISGIGPTKLEKLSRTGVTTLEQLAQCPQDAEVGVAPKTLARWREIARCKLRHQRTKATAEA